MHWVIQNNLYREHNHQILMDTVKRYGIPHTLVELSSLSDVLTPEINVDGLIYCCGSVKLSRIARNRKWAPGSFLNENHRFEKWVEHWGQHMFNADAVFGDLGTVVPPLDGEFFIRPCEDTKSFSGKCFYLHEFSKWRQRMLESGCEYIDSNFVRHKHEAKADTKVMLSPVKKILSEFRFFVVDGKVVTSSQYKMGGKYYTNSCVDPYLTDYAQAMVDIWQPARAFVIDIFNSELGPKIGEINNINCSGFYDCDVSKLVEAIESMVFP